MVLGSQGTRADTCETTTKRDLMTMKLQTLVATVALILVAVAAPAMASHTSGPMMVGDAITEEFALAPEEVHDLHEMGIGFGAIFQLQILAIAVGVDVATLLATMEVDPETGEYDFAFGELRNSLSDEQLALIEDLPQNLGQIVSEASRPDHAGEGKPEWAGEGKPPWAGGGGDDDDEVEVEDDDGDA
jgi:hypothetical protein